MIRVFMATCGGALVAALAAVSASAQPAAPQPAAPQPAASQQRSPEAIALQTAVERVCLPVLRGQEMAGVADAAGVRRKDGNWSLPAQGAADVQISPPTKVNPHVCSLHLTVAPGGAGGLTGLLDRWSQARGLHPVKVGEASRGPYMSRNTWTWEGTTADGAMALVFDVAHNLDGSPVDGANATALVSLTPRSQS